MLLKVSWAQFFFQTAHLKNIFPPDHPRTNEPDNLKQLALIDIHPRLKSRYLTSSMFLKALDSPAIAFSYLFDQAYQQWLI